MKQTQCPLCGYNLDKNKDKLNCHEEHCPGNCGGCKAARCPNCGYALHQESTLSRLISNVFKLGGLDKPRTGSEKR